MPIFGIGAYYDADVSDQFISAGLAGVGWSEGEAPDLHQMVKAIKPGDIVYLKAFPPSTDLIVKAIGIVLDDSVVNSPSSNGLVSFGRRVAWVVREPFTIAVTQSKNNVRANTVYEEYHSDVQRQIIERLLANL